MVPSPSPESEEFNARVRARVGTVLKDKWRLEHVLGVGGMAAVYAARHRNGKRVAVKILHQEISMDSSVRARFVREGYVANSIGHRLAVSVDDDDVTDDGSAFLVMELLEGETVEARWDRLGQRLPVGDVLYIVDQLLDVLAVAHDKGVVHRDIKPENLFLTREGELKVLDFGIARVREISAGSSSATRPGGLLGTPAFMAPEQASGRWSDIDARTDIWAVGATMFTLLCGEWVHEASTPNEILGHAMLTRARSLASVRDDLPPKLLSIVDKALSYEQTNRWPDARTLRAALAEQVWIDGVRPRLAFESFARLEDISSSAPTLSASASDDEPGSPARTASERPTGTGTLQSAGSSGARQWPREQPPPNRKFVALLVLGALAVACAVASIVYIAGRPHDAAPAERALSDDQRDQHPQRPAPANAHPSEPTVSPVSVATEVATTAGTAPPVSNIASEPVKRTPRPSASSSHATPTSAPKPSATATATSTPPAATAKSNPLDRRY